MDDFMLWTKLKQGNHQALKQIYDFNVNSLGNYALKFTSDSALIEDTIHDIFVQIWQKRESIGNTDSIIKYLCVALRRELIRRVNKGQNIVGYDHIESKETDFTLSVEDLLIDQESLESNKSKLNQALQSLSNRQREAIYLKYYEEMDYEQICEVMNINYQSVRNLISKGILELRTIFSLMFLLLTIITLLK